MQNVSPPRGIDSGNVQLVASRYTDYAIPGYFPMTAVKPYQLYKNPDYRDEVGLRNDALLEPNARLSALEDLTLCSRTGSNEQ